MASPTVIITTYVSVELSDLLDERMKKDGKSRSDVIREAIKKYLDVK